MMRVLLVTPRSQAQHSGNAVTAERWAAILRGLGHDVQVVERYSDQDADLLLALHAARSADSIRRFAQQRPQALKIVALTGTDIYRDPPLGTDVLAVLALADRLIELQPLASRELPPSLQHKVRTIYQSTPRLVGPVEPRSDRFELCVIGNLREVKDPLRAAMAAQRLPGASKIHVLHVGAALDPEMERRAVAEAQSNPRYRWLGELPRREALAIMVASRALVHASLQEGGANVVSEALVHQVPVLASQIPGSVGLLGLDYPGYFPPQDTAALAELMRRCETEPQFLPRLAAHGARLAGRFEPAAEVAAWQGLLHELAPSN